MAAPSESFLEHEDIELSSKLKGLYPLSARHSRQNPKHVKMKNEKRSMSERQIQ